MQTERLFIFNPFNIKNWQDHEVEDQYTILENSLTRGDTPSEIAYDIEVYANMGYLMGEMIARYYEYVEKDSIVLKVGLSNQLYKERDQWMREKSEKIPAMSYFEAKALSMLLEEHTALIKREAIFKRFKFAYESIEHKQNALKKKLEAVKYDTFNK